MTHSLYRAQDYGSIGPAPTLSSYRIKTDTGWIYQIHSS